MSNVKPVCPRCGGYIPSNENPGVYMGAMSRVDNRTEICSACGTEEALQQFASQSASGATPIEEWPIESDRKVGA